MERESVTTRRPAHPLAGQTVRVRLKFQHPDIRPVRRLATGDEFRIEDWWENVSGGSWMDASGNPAALVYAMRSGLAHLPIDNEVVYGKIGPFGHLVHASELGPVVTSDGAE